MLKKLAVSITAATMFATTAIAADTVKIGFVTTLTTPAAVLGNDMKNAVDLAVEMIGGKIAGMDVEIVYEDDAFNPQTGRTKSEKLANDPDIKFVAGYIWSHVLLASKKVVLDSGKFLISSNAGPSQLAGEECHENFFSTSWQNDQTPMALGEVLNQRGIKSIYVVAPNYAAGKNMVAGVERTFKGEILGRDMTKWGKDAQLDFSAELAKARASGAEAIFAFYPGKAGGAFIKQYQQAGLAGVMPLYTVFTVDAISLPKFQEAGMEGVLGTLHTQTWSPDLDNEQNKAFVAAFRAKYGSYPSFYAQQSYDTIFLIKSAVEAVNGNLDDMDGMRAAMETANYPSTRGSYTYGNNHFPIQNIYLREAVVGDDGQWTTKIVSTVYENHQDSYAANCPL
ncbi:MAG: ABC transporter substrate-binding protein [Fimbriimonadaceae bacterium]|nr:ABC transporter substrate-binding protein [Alphaproteobacteria bacterium]